MNRRTLILGLAIVLYIGLRMFLGMPAPLVKNLAETEVSQVWVAEESEDGAVFVDVTERVDLEQLEVLLFQYKHKRMIHLLPVFNLQEGDVKIRLEDGTEHGRFILLSGKNPAMNVMYTDFAEGGYYIEDSDELLQKLAGVLQPAGIALEEEKGISKI